MMTVLWGRKGTLCILKHGSSQVVRKLNFRKQVCCKRYNLSCAEGLDPNNYLKQTPYYHPVLNKIIEKQTSLACFRKLLTASCWKWGNSLCDESDIIENCFDSLSALLEMERITGAMSVLVTLLSMDPTWLRCWDTVTEEKLLLSPDSSDYSDWIWVCSFFKANFLTVFSYQIASRKLATWRKDDRIVYVLWKRFCGVG